jgi:hypothetical protein
VRLHQSRVGVKEEVRRMKEEGGQEVVGKVKAERWGEVINISD